MPEVRLKFSGSEVTLKEGVTTLGRTDDNDISFPADTNVSRYHAEIEFRGGEFCLIDLNSSNGTAVNGSKVSGETYLKPGDVILLGGSSEIIFEGPKEADEPAAHAASASAASSASSASPQLPLIADAVRQAPGLSASQPAAAEGSRTMLMIAGGAVLLALVVVVAAGAIYYKTTTAACMATAKITKPDEGDTLLEPTEVEVELENEECVARAVYTLDGVEFDSSADAPFTITLDPQNHPDLADGIDHSLGVYLVDEDGKKIPQSGEVMLVLDTRKVEKPETKPEIPQGPGPRTPGGGETRGKEPTLIKMAEMTNRMVKQFSGNHRYNVSNQQFLQAVQKKAAEFAQDGYYERAAKYRDSINVGFVKEQNLDPALAYMLAMSRSRFDPQKQGSEEGLWRMNSEFVKSNAYDGACGGQTISEPTQLCASRAAAVYMKAILHGVFDGDVVYSAAAFGKSPADASAWKAGLPVNRQDVWNTIKTPAEREALVRFFAAGIVADNPAEFGLKRDSPISGLYP